MFKLNYSITRFLSSVSNVNNMPDSGIEIAIVGYSNTGKSKILNILTNQKKLARSSKTPGCTKLINIFEVTQGKYLIDLPGYGYSKLSNNSKWQYYEYIKNRKMLKGIVLIMDIRYPLKKLDYKIIDLASKKKICLLILLNKADKLTFSKKKIQLNKVKNKLSNILTNIQIELFSSINKIGISELQKQLDIWFNNSNKFRYY
ncbi:MAG: YihA family ribosome biogenesis GTP-binding protein [Pantoea sp. Brub]|nr:YihA family ribosome biogenesis GTP-binding protein [Pantoea sp. Brub]